MGFAYKNLLKNNKFEKQIEITCNMNGAKCEFIQGKIIDVNKINISFIQPHRINITIKSHKLLVIYFNKDNLFLYDRTMPITINNLVIFSKLENVISDRRKKDKVRYCCIERNIEFY